MQLNLNSLIDYLTDSSEGEVAIIDFTGLNLISKQNLFQFSIFDRDALGKTLHEIQSTPLETSKENIISKLIIIDHAYLLNTQEEQTEIFYVKDHVNLSTLNPLIGTISRVGEPRFFPVNEIYLKPSGLISDSKKGTEVEVLNSCTVAGLNSKAKPNIDEMKILNEAGISHYCYNLVLTSLMAAHKDFKILGLVVVENHNQLNTKLQKVNQ
ncbi:MAG: hypothetical protein ACK481_02450 [Candidatus Melainabacteria bacterium]|jgi:hypothetical protein